MGHHGVVVRVGEKRRLRVHTNVRHEFSVSLSREDEVDVFLVTLLKVCEMPFWGVLKNVFTRQDHGWKRKLSGAQHFLLRVDGLPPPLHPVQALASISTNNC